MGGETETVLTRHSRQVYTADRAQTSFLVLLQSLRHMHRGWACCRRPERSAGVSGVWVRHLSAPERDRWGIDGRLGGYDLCRIGCHIDIGLVGGRASGKTRGNSVRRWEASPSHAQVQALRVGPAKHCTVHKRGRSRSSELS